MQIADNNLTNHENPLILLIKVQTNFGETKQLGFHATILIKEIYI